MINSQVRQQKMLPTIRSYLKLYTTLPLVKLAAFMSAARGGERDAAREHAALAIHLLCFKHKMKNVVWSKGPSGLDGKFQSGSEVGTFRLRTHYALRKATIKFKKRSSYCTRSRIR